MAQTFTLPEKPAITDLDGVHASRDFRRQAIGPQWAGVLGQADFKVSLTSGRGFAVAGGSARVRGGNQVDQGYYRQRQASAISAGLDVSANGDANPRLDQIVLRIYDDAYDSSGFSEGRIEVIPGTATAAATLANRTGAALPSTIPGPKAMILLADILVPGGNPSNIPAGNIRDRRRMAEVSAIPQILSDTLILQSLFPYPSLPYWRSAINGSDHNTKVSACLWYLPDEMPMPTRYRWHYVNGDNAGANPIGAGGSYMFGMYTSDGRKIWHGGASFSGAAGQVTERIDCVVAANGPIIETVMPSGLYWVAFALTGVGAAGVANYVGVTADNTQARGLQPPAPNMFLRATSGGTAAITGNSDLRDMGFGDAFSIGIGAHLPVPQIVLEP